MMESRHRAAWQAALDSAPDSAAGLAALSDPRLHALLSGIFGNSPFLSHCLALEPALPLRLFSDGPDRMRDAILEELSGAARGLTDTPSLMRVLRIGRRRIALVTALADLAGLWPLAPVCTALSRLAEIALSLGIAHLMRRAHAAGELVLPFPDEPERDCALTVLAMGKLGAEELNYSSDIDLIILYDAHKVAYRGRRSPAELFVGMARELTRILSEVTGDGFVFRVDLRLRPDPGAMPLAVSLEAAETYYEAFGQNWERAAMIKARAVAGDREVGIGFLTFIRRFIWRKYLDFAAIQDIHSIKRQIDSYRGGGRIAVYGHNIKLGRSGIREIEFFVQTQQLIRGGREAGLRSPRTLEALVALGAAGHVSPEAVAELSAAYRYLRALEHRLQMIDDRQTQTLPAESGKLEALAIFMGHDGIPDFEARLRQTLQDVARHYARLFEDAPPLAPHGDLVFTGIDDDPGTIETLRGLGFSAPAKVSAIIRGWHHGRVRASRSTRARELLTELVPTLLEALSRTADPSIAFGRFDTFLAGLPIGVPLFSLFHSNPALLDTLAGIMGDAPRLAELLNRKPALLDLLLDHDFFGTPRGRATLSRDLAATMAVTLEDAGGSYEAMLDSLRRWADEHRFRIGLLTLFGRLGARESARHLTDIADCVLTWLTPRVQAEFALRHGRAPGRGMALIAMGRMGGREMTAASDIDLILVYDAAEPFSDGPEPLAASLYYARLTQRLITALSARTAEGVLYDVDLRLRPSGTSGPIATSLAAFRLYHRGEAWTWEHMALTRARVICGDPPLRAAIRAEIRNTLRARREPAKLRFDVADMRERIAREHRPASPWDAKFARGGLVDLDFIAQYLALRWAADHPGLLGRGTAALLRHAVRSGVLAEGDAAVLLDGLDLWTAIQQVLRHAISGEPGENQISPRLRAVLAAAAGCVDFDDLCKRRDSSAAAIKAIYDSIVGQPAPARD